MTMQAIPEDILYVGRSMEGTFAFGDRLVIDPSDEVPIDVGDILVYQPPDEEGKTRYVVHRVVEKTRDGFVVQGDRNRFADPCPVHREHVVGKVVAVSRSGETVELPSRVPPLRSQKPHGLSRLGSSLLRLAKPLLRGPYGKLRESGLLHRLWRPAIRSARFQTRHGMEVKYVFKDRTVGLYNPANRRYAARKPYDLFLKKDGSS